MPAVGRPWPSDNDDNDDNDSSSDQVMMVVMMSVVMMKMMVVVFFFFLRTSPTRLDQYSRLPRLPCCYSRHHDDVLDHGDDLDDDHDDYLDDGPCVLFTTDSAGP